MADFTHFARDLNLQSFGNKFVAFEIKPIEGRASSLSRMAVSERLRCYGYK